MPVHIDEIVATVEPPLGTGGEGSTGLPRGAEGDGDVLDQLRLARERMARLAVE